MLPHAAELDHRRQLSSMIEHLWFSSAV
jgi:hypothetical protein